MLYIGNFSYTDFREGCDNICLMPAIVEAPDAKEALARFDAMLTSLHETSPLAAGADEIYLDSLVELSEAPENALLLQWQKLSATDDGLYSAVSTLPGHEGEAKAYVWDADNGLTELDTTGEDAIATDAAEDLAQATGDDLEGISIDDIPVLSEDDFENNEAPFLSFA